MTSCLQVVGAGAGDDVGPDRKVVATTVLELYGQTSAFGRRLRLAHNCTGPLWVYNASISVLDLVEDRSITTHTDASVADARLISERYPPQPQVAYHTSGFASTPGLPFFGPGLSDWQATHPAFESYFVAEVVRDVGYNTVQNPTHRGMTRYARRCLWCAHACGAPRPGTTVLTITAWTNQHTLAL